MIVFVLLALSIGQIVADTIVKDDPARFDGIAADADGNYVPVSGEVDTVEVFDVHRLGEQFNDTGLAINVSVTGLNQTNTPHTTRYVTIPPFKSLPASPPRFWNFDIPLKNATASNGTNITGLSYAPPKLFGFWSPPSQNGSYSTFAPFQYPNFGFKRSFNQDGAGNNHVGGPHASEAFSKSASGFVDKNGDYNSLDAMGEKGNITLSSILGRLLDAITPKRDDNTHILAQYVDEAPTDDYGDGDITETRPIAANNDDSVIDINPQIYADIWNPAKWNSFTNISFDKEQPPSLSSSIAKSSSGLWNEALWAKLAAIQRNATRDLAAFGMPQWTLNYSAPEVQQLMQNAFLLNLTDVLYRLNSTTSSLLPPQLTKQMSASLRSFLSALSPPSDAFNMWTNSSTTIPTLNLPFFNALASFKAPTLNAIPTSSTTGRTSTTKSSTDSTPTNTVANSQPDLTQLLSNINTVLQKLNRNMGNMGLSQENDSGQILDKSIVVKDTKRLFLSPEQDEIIADPAKDEFLDELPIASSLRSSQSGMSQMSPFLPVTIIVGMVAGTVYNRFLLD